jgi:hypothetical protein
MTAQLASVGLQAGAILGEAGIMGGAEENQAVQNSAVFNPALSINTTGYNQFVPTQNNTNVIFFVIAILAVIGLMYFVI